MKFGRSISRLAISVALLLPLMAPVSFAATAKTDDKKSDTPSATGGGSVQGYSADKALQTGTVVQLVGDGAAKVAPATSKNLNQMYGVVVDPHTLSLTLSSANLTNETYVSTSGTYDALISSQGGAISAGDYLTLSAIDGVLMKAGTDEPTVFGRAGAGFSGKSGVGSVTLKDTTGQTTQTVTLGVIPVAISIQRNPNKKSTKAEVPQFLQRIGQAVAEKPVGPLRIYLSMAITALSIVIAIVILYSGIRNSLIAIGRNPLSKKSVFRGLLEIILTSFLILIIGLFTVYLLLKL
jgi:hypothetical protein